MLNLQCPTEIKDLKAQIEEKKEKLEDAEKKELELRKQKRDLEEEKAKFDLKFQRELDAQKKIIEESTAKKISDEHQLKDKENDKKITDLTQKINELKRQAEQGSQKLQGEVFERDLEYRLRNQFNSDEIEPVSSKGADILQKVYSRSGKLCGTILIESKNTKNWSNNWISKLKQDQRDAKADIGIIISTVMPEGVENFRWQEGIMVVKYAYAVPVINLLREQLSEVDRVRASSRGVNQKINLLQAYLTGNEFKQRVESIFEAITSMHEDLQKEKRAMARLWSKREKQIEQAGNGMLSAYGSMQGILGPSMPEIKSLEMPDNLSEDSGNEYASDK